MCSIGTINLNTYHRKTNHRFGTGQALSSSCVHTVHLPFKPVVGPLELLNLAALLVVLHRGEPIHVVYSGKVVP